MQIIKSLANQNLQKYGTMFFLVLVSSLLLVTCSVKEQTNKIEYTWESVKKVPVPDWFEDAKFGIFIHWGAYSVPGIAYEGYAEWYPHFMYRTGKTRKYHLEKYGSKLGYADFIDQFKAENWDPQAWADLFRKSGAKYIVPVAEHHDGFAMWDSDLTQWNAMDRGPKRDIIGELAVAVRKHDLKYVPSFHRERHFAYFDSTMVAPEIITHPERADLYAPFSLTQEFIDDYKARWKELEKKYQPDFMWLDHVPYFQWTDKHYADMIPKYKSELRNLVVDYLNKESEWGKNIYFNNKGQKRHGINFPVGVREGDNLIMNDKTQKWQNPATIAHSYGYNRLEEEHESYKSANTLIDLLIDIVSKNGNLLLNIGPRSDGTISEIQKERLLQIGKWLGINGEGIYGSRPWREFGEGPNKVQKDRYSVNAFTSNDYRFTQKENTVYAFIMEWPEQKRLTINSFIDEKVTSVELLGHGVVKFKLTNTGLEVHLPDNRPCNAAYTLKIQTI